MQHPCPILGRERACALFRRHEGKPHTVPALTRRRLLISTAGLAGAAALGACGKSSKTVAATSEAIRRAEAVRRGSGARVVTATR